MRLDFIAPFEVDQRMSLWCIEDFSSYATTLDFSERVLVDVRYGERCELQKVVKYRDPEIDEDIIKLTLLFSKYTIRIKLDEKFYKLFVNKSGFDDEVSEYVTTPNAINLSAEWS